MFPRDIEKIYLIRHVFLEMHNFNLEYLVLEILLYFLQLPTTILFRAQSYKVVVSIYWFICGPSLIFIGNIIILSFLIRINFLQFISKCQNIYTMLTQLCSLKVTFYFQKCWIISYRLNDKLSCVVWNYYKSNLI